MTRRIPAHIQLKLSELKENYHLRSLRLSTEDAIDFSSNDYLGIAGDLLGRSPELADLGAKGSRLLSGNSEIHEKFEAWAADFYESPAALLYGSGYMANIGLVSCLAQKGDLILYDQFVHASIRDGIRLSQAENQKFAHNDCEALERQILAAKNHYRDIYVLSEGLFSMDGDIPDLARMLEICERYGAFLIVDEAHSTGIFGEKGQGILHEMKLHSRAFIRVMTFGKAIGRKAALVLCDSVVKDFLINRSRSFIFSTAPSPQEILHLQTAILLAAKAEEQRKTLQLLSDYANQVFSQIPHIQFSPNHSPIKALIIPGNKDVILAAEKLQAEKLDIRPIRYPTVPLGAERLRVVLHSFNTKLEIDKIANILSKEKCKD